MMAGRYGIAARIPLQCLKQDPRRFSLGLTCERRPGGNGLAEIREQLKKAEAQRKSLAKEKEKLRRELWDREGEIRDREDAIAVLKDKRDLERTLELKDPDAIVKKLRGQLGAANAGQKADMLFRRGKDAYDTGDLEL